jgi:hypothetical protein
VVAITLSYSRMDRGRGFNDMKDLLKFEVLVAHVYAQP